MNELEQRVKTLEEKVKILEETLETLSKSALSEQMENYLQRQNRAVRMVDLINAVSEDEQIDFVEQKKIIDKIGIKKTSIKVQVAEAVRRAGTFSEDFSNDPRYFNVEMGEDGITITSYNGFEANRIVVPSEIDGISVVRIGDMAFENAVFSDVILPKSLRIIGKKAFRGCKNISKIDLPDSLTDIKENAFEGCTGLTDVLFGNKLKNIEKKAFSGNVNLYRIDLPNSLTKIGESAFYGCSGLLIVGIENGLQAINNSAFRKCKRLTKVYLPDSMILIGKNAFRDCIGLTDVQFGYCLKCIDNAAFAGCKNLTKIEFPDSLAEIGENAFYDCSKLSDVTFGNSLKSIGRESFGGCQISRITLSEELKCCAGYRTPWGDEIHCTFETTNSCLIIVPEKTTSIDEYAFYKKDNACRQWVFLGMESSVKKGNFGRKDIVYCLPGSKIQHQARGMNISYKPLSEFRMEDYQ